MLRVIAWVCPSVSGAPTRTRDENAVFRCVCIVLVISQFYFVLHLSDRTLDYSKIAQVASTNACSARQRRRVARYCACVDK